MSKTFEWHDDKAAKNLLDHKVTFPFACGVFEDHFAVEWIDDRMDYGEERCIRIGMAKGVLLFVVYTERGDVIRIISARRANRHEQDDYYSQNGP